MTTPGRRKLVAAKNAKIHNRISPKQMELQPGDGVTVQMDDGRLFETICTSMPWQIGGDGGAWVVMAEGIRGCFALCRVQPRPT